jgi:hypothetical protein
LSQAVEKLEAYLTEFSFIKPTPPQNRQINILMTMSKQSVDDFMGGLTF